MSRIIFILVLLAVGYLLLTSWQRRKQLKRDNSKDSGKKAGKTSSGLSKNNHNNERIVRCEYCQLHVPEHEAVNHGGTYTCSLEHAQRLVEQRNKDKDRQDH